jgi:hypothetical protein
MLGIRQKKKLKCVGVKKRTNKMTPLYPSEGFEVEPLEYTIKIWED